MKEMWTALTVDLVTERFAQYDRATGYCMSWSAVGIPPQLPILTCFITDSRNWSYTIAKLNAPNEKDKIGGLGTFNGRYEDAFFSSGNLFPIVYHNLPR